MPFNQPQPACGAAHARRINHFLGSCLIAALLLYGPPARAQDGVVTKQAHGEFRQAVQTLVKGIEAKNLTLFATINHSAGAEDAGLSLRPTTLLVFGSPKAGTPLMQQNQLLGLELPLKLLIWQNEAGKVMVSYTQPAWTVQRFGLDPAKQPIPAMAATLASLAELAAKQ